MQTEPSYTNRQTNRAQKSFIKELRHLHNSCKLE